MSGSDYTLTPNYGFYLPVPNADNDVWGDHVNQNTSTLDGLLKTIQNTSGVTSFNTRTGPVTLNTTDVTTVLPPSAGTPAMDGTPTPGVVNTWSRGDHVHPTDTTRYAASNPAGYVTAAGAAGAAPVQSFNTRTGAIVLNTADVTTVLPPSSTTPVMDGTAAVGVGTTWARADHVHPSDTTRQTAAQVQTAVAPALNNAGRNLVHNPLFNISQRTGPWTTNGVYTVDRWYQGFTNGTQSTSRVALTDADRTAIGDEAAIYALQSVVVGGAPAGSATVLAHALEGVRRTSGKTFTVSFDAKAASGTPKIGISLDQYFGTGGSPSATVPGTGQSVTISTTWTRYSLTFAMPSATGKTLGTNGDDSVILNVWLSAGTNFATGSGSVGVQSGTFSLWGVQLEIGPTATPLEKPEPQQDLAKCQRFFRTVICCARGSYSAGMSLITPATWEAMRASPTVTLNTAGVVSNAGSPSLVAATAYGGYFGGATSAAGDGYLLNYIYNLSADL